MKYLYKRFSRLTQKGFTIVELLIATLVFSLILLVITAGVLHFTNAYYKGINSSTTQNTARSIVDTVGQAIQFSGTTINTTGDTGGSYFCAGGSIYIFKPGVQYMGGAPIPTNPGLYVIPQAGCTPPGSYSGGKQLLGPHMRIGSLDVQAQGNQTYSVAITLVYSSGGNPAQDGNDLLTGSGASTRCLSQIGSQFCAVSTLVTTVQQRVANSELSN